MTCERNALVGNEVMTLFDPGCLSCARHHIWGILPDRTKASSKPLIPAEQGCNALDIASFSCDLWREVGGLREYLYFLLLLLCEGPAACLLYTELVTPCGVAR